MHRPFILAPPLPHLTRLPVQRRHIASIPISLDVHSVLCDGMRMFENSLGACTMVLQHRLDLSAVPCGKLRWMTVTTEACESFEQLETFAAWRNTLRDLAVPHGNVEVRTRCLGSVCENKGDYLRYRPGGPFYTLCRQSYPHFLSSVNEA